MTSIRHSYLFSVLVTITVLPLDASSLQNLRQSNNPVASLRKCLRHLENQQADVNFRSQFSRKNLADDVCGNLLDHLLTKIPLLSDQQSESQFGSVNVDPRLLLPDAQGVMYPNLDTGLYAKFEATKMKKNTSQKLATLRKTLLEDLPNRDGMDHPISPVRGDLLTDKSTADFIQSLPFVKNSFKSRNTLISKLVDRENLQSKTPFVFNTRQGKIYGDSVDDYDNDDESIPAQNEQASSRDRISPLKRAPDNWLRVVSTEVAKRRRQTLSINNALMALTDMVMEHGREKLMRNRDNLRYHMYIQG